MFPEHISPVGRSLINTRTRLIPGVGTREAPSAPKVYSSDHPTTAIPGQPDRK